MVASRMQFDLIALFPVQNSPRCLKHLVMKSEPFPKALRASGPGIWPNLPSPAGLCMLAMLHLDKNIVAGFCMCMESFYLHAFVLAVYLSSWQNEFLITLLG